ncbi:sigma-54-dependent transcriptional regulator [Pleionea sediminis]|uniref:sigma-54-dependent transcriptional regulator n=1 Tax=Pleionea sediminis TaxID=2569479 RepID=UPI001185C84E|nr:sigma-54 dependent transcriptional regulator [Pleionea sediminis]
MNILIVEDEKNQRELIKTIIEKSTDDICNVSHSAEDALSQLKKQRFDLVLSDWQLGEMDGLALMENCQKQYPDTSFILMTAYGSISHAVTSIRAGADDYLSKPFEKEQLLFVINKIRNARQLKAENLNLKTANLAKERLGNIIGSSSRMQQLYRQIEKLSDTNITVLVHGESGTGKELVAEALHKHSHRNNQPFIAVNCSAIPDSIAESELFGAEKGAYTGSNQRREGKIKAADGGTLFLDEIADLTPAIQAKLLRFLQEGKIMRVGSNQEISVDVRVITASHKSLSQEVSLGNFREDLFHRLNVIPLELPALRERLDDLPSLLDFFIHKFSKKHQSQPIQFNRSAINALYDYHWPGNIRELSNLVERLTILHSEQPVDCQELPFYRTTPELNDTFELPPEGINWDAHEKSVLSQALTRSQGNRTKAARLLGLNYKAFLYRLEKHNIA